MPRKLPTTVRGRNCLWRLHLTALLLISCHNVIVSVDSVWYWSRESDVPVAAVTLAMCFIFSVNNKLAVKISHQRFACVTNDSKVSSYILPYGHIWMKACKFEPLSSSSTDFLIIIFSFSRSIVDNYVVHVVKTELVGTTVILASDLGWDSRWRISNFLPKDTYNQPHGFIVSWSFEVKQPINILLITRHVKFCHFLLNHRTFVWCGSPVHWNAPNSSRV